MREGKIAKRTIALFCAMLIFFCGLIVRILTLATHNEYVQAASAQSTYRITVDTSRGRIYDCKMRSLAGGRLCYRAIIEPSSETIEHLSGILNADEMNSISEKLTGRAPFLFTVKNAAVEGPGARVYRCEERYGINSVAHHTIGYLDGSGKGVSGIELAFNDYLTECSGSITAYHTVNSGGRSLSGSEPVVVDTTFLSSGGIVLSLDMDIQQIAEDAADKFIERGAIVVMEAKTGRIRAIVSRPLFEQNNVAASISCDDGQLVNRAISAYDVGSVFKLVVAAAALENGVDASTVFLCEGSTQIGNNVFHCSNRSGHGEIDMSQATARSCNIYFIELANLIGGERLLRYAESLGFGSKINLADNYSTQQGCLPESLVLLNPAALANFSFGQGELMATPVHIARLIAAIANNGAMPDCTVYEYLVDYNGNKFSLHEPETVQVMKSATAESLRFFMREAVISGTGKPGASEYISSGAKTGTAQTGIVRDGKNILQAWYAGFFPFESPEYVCVVLIENGVSGGADAGPVFRYIMDEIM